MRLLKNNQVDDSFNKKKSHFLMIISLLKNLQSIENQCYINFYFETFR